MEGVGKIHIWALQVTLMVRTLIDLLYKDTLHSRFNIKSSLHDLHLYSHLTFV